MAPMDTIWLFSVHTLWLPITLHPYRNACGIGYTIKKLSKMAGNSASYPFNNWCIDSKTDSKQLQNRGEMHASICFPPEIQYFK